MTDDEILERAREILASRLRRCCVGARCARPGARKYLTVLHYAERCSTRGFEIVVARRAQCIDRKDELMFRGTLTQTSVYPREVVKSALLKNAAACIVYHNHPSGATEPKPG